MQYFSGFRLRRRDLIVSAAALAATGMALSTRPASAAASEWRRVRAFGVELDVPAQWKRFDYRKPPEDHDEVQFAENPRDIAAGAWLSVFPTNVDLIDPEREEKTAIVDGRPAKLTDFTSPANEPSPRRQVIVYFSDARAPAFLFDGDASRWNVLGPILEHILASVRLPTR